MATKQEVLDAIAAEGQEVADRILALENRIEELIAAGQGASAADLDEILAGVRAIHTPPSA